MVAGGVRPGRRSRRKAQLFEGRTTCQGLARLEIGETQIFAPGMACTNLIEDKLPGRRSRRKAQLFEGRTTCQGLARLEIGETQIFAPGMACTNLIEDKLPGRRSRRKAQLFEGRTTCQGRGQAITKHQFRAQAERHQAVLDGRTGKAGDWRNPNIRARDGMHKPNRGQIARSAQPTKSAAFRGPNDLPRARTSDHETSVSCAGRAPSSCA